MSTEQEKQVEQESLRSPQEVRERLEKLESRLAIQQYGLEVITEYRGNSWIMRPVYPEIYRECEVLIGKISELKWYLGEDLAINNGVE
jgi:hypothetical protein